MNATNWYKIDYVGNKIILTKAFAKGAAVMETAEYKEMVKLRKAFPSFDMKIKTIRKKEGKKTNKNVTYENMKRYISALEGEDSINIANINRLIECRIQRSTYTFVKNWFMANYPDYTNPEQLVTKIETIVPHGVDSYIEEMKKSAQEKEAAA